MSETKTEPMYQGPLGGEIPAGVPKSYSVESKPAKGILIEGMPMPKLPPDQMPPVGFNSGLAHRIARYRQTVIVNHHEEVHEVMKRNGLPTDDSVRLLDSAGQPLDHDDILYNHVNQGQKVIAAPADRIFAKHKEAEPYKEKLLRSPERSVLKTDEFNVVDSDGAFSRPDVLVKSPEEEKDARSDGFTVEVPAPEPEDAPKQDEGLPV